jgi:hypothetical protein
MKKVNVMQVKLRNERKRLYKLHREHISSSSSSK